MFTCPELPCFSGFCKEKFAGSVHSQTLEAFIPETGRGIQAGIFQTPCCFGCAKPGYVHHGMCAMGVVMMLGGSYFPLFGAEICGDVNLPLVWGENWQSWGKCKKWMGFVKS